MKIGYARVSSAAQNLDRQIEALKAEGCDRLYCEKVSGKSMANRPELAKALKSLDINDVLVLAEWDRATRSMQDGLSIIQRVAEKGALIKVLDRQWLDLTTPIGKGILAFLSALAEDERLRIRRRCQEGLKIAKAKGKAFGRTPALTEHQVHEILERKAEGESVRDLAKSYGVGSSTIHRVCTTDYRDRNSVQKTRRKSA